MSLRTRRRLVSFTLLFGGMNLGAGIMAILVDEFSGLLMILAGVVGVIVGFTNSAREKETAA